MVAPHGHSSSRHVFPMNPANRSKITSSLFEEEEGKQSAATTLPKSLSVSPQRKLKPRIKPLLRWLRLVLFAASIGRLAAVGGTNIEIRSLRDSDFMNQTSGLAMESVGDGGVFVPIVPLTEGGGLGRDDEFLKVSFGLSLLFLVLSEGGSGRFVGDAGGCSCGVEQPLLHPQMVFQW